MSNVLELIENNATKVCIQTCFYKSGNRISTKKCIDYCQNNQGNQSNQYTKNNSEINIKILMIIMLIILIKQILF